MNILCVERFCEFFVCRQIMSFCVCGQILWVVCVWTDSVSCLCVDRFCELFVCRQILWIFCVWTDSVSCSCVDRFYEFLCVWTDSVNCLCVDRFCEFVCVWTDSPSAGGGPQRTLHSQASFASPLLPTWCKLLGGRTVCSIVVFLLWGVLILL